MLNKSFNQFKVFSFLALFGLILFNGISLSTIFAVNNVTICHAAGRAGTTQFVTLNLPDQAVYGQAGHFNENGTTQAGHEQDYLGACIEASPSPTPTPTISASPSPTPSASTSPTPSVTPIPSASPTPSPTPDGGGQPSGSFSPTPTPSATPSLSPSPSASASASPSTNSGGTSSGDNGDNLGCSVQDCSGNQSGASQGTTSQGDILGATTLAPTGSTSDLMTFMFVLGIVFLALSANSYAQEKVN